MGRFSRFVLFFALMLAAALSLPAQTTLQGVVTDSAGAAIGKAVVRIHWDPVSVMLEVNSAVTRRDDIVVQTAEDGSYSVSLPPGFYDVFVSSASFDPTAKKVRTRPDKPSRFSPKLQLSKIVCDEMCETIATPAK